MRDTIDMAREAGFTWEPINNIIGPLKRFEQLARADEREACAKVCEAVHTGSYDTPEFWREGVAYTCAAAIRVRGQA